MRKRLEQLSATRSCTKLLLVEQFQRVSCNTFWLEQFSEKASLQKNGHIPFGLPRTQSCQCDFVNSLTMSLNFWLPEFLTTATAKQPNGHLAVRPNIRSFGPTAVQPSGRSAVRPTRQLGERPFGGSALQPNSRTAVRPFGRIAERLFGPTARTSAFSRIAQRSFG